MFQREIEQLAGIQRIKASEFIVNKTHFATQANSRGSSMIVEAATQARSAHVIVVGNEKGGSGKSTVAMHIAIALIKSGQRVVTIDLDARQKSFTHYIENRRAWAKRVARDLEIPDHICIGRVSYPTAEDEAAGCKALADAVETFKCSSSFVVIDTPGHDGYLTRHAHSLADTLITPLNDSFVDFDVLGTVDPETFGVSGTSHYSQMVEEARGRRYLLDHVTPDWVVLRNRLSMLGSRNRRLVGEGLQELSLMYNFRCIDGLAERVIFREFFPRGLTAVDDLDEITLGTRPTMSHVSARREMQMLLSAMRFGSAISDEMLGQKRDAA
jgi:chromosome partitioning protein